MIRQDFTADFTTLRNAYSEVKNFMEEETRDKVTSLSTTIEDDLGCTGDDNYYLLVKFIEKYDLKHDEFDYKAHFLSEGELFDTFSVLTTLISLPFQILKWATSNKVNLLPPKGYLERERLDLTFGDMLAWYLTKEFRHRADLHIMLPH